MHNKNKPSIERQPALHDQRLKAASLWLLVLTAVLAVLLWAGNVADAKANETNQKSTISHVWSEIVKGKSIESVMQAAGFCINNDAIPDWVLEICDEDLTDHAYIDDKAGIIGLVLEEDPFTAIAYMKTTLTAHGWAEIVTDDVTDTKSPNRLSDETRETMPISQEDYLSEGNIFSFVKEKGVSRWLTMECAKSANGANMVLHIERI